MYLGFELNCNLKDVLCVLFLKVLSLEHPHYCSFLKDALSGTISLKMRSHELLKEHFDT